MTHRGKWAFRYRERAEGFLREHGGVMVDFQTAMRASYEDARIPGPSGKDEEEGRTSIGGEGADSKNQQ